MKRDAFSSGARPADSRTIAGRSGKFLFRHHVPL